MKKKYKFDGKVTNIVCKGCVIGGDFTSPESTRIDGEVKGSVSVKGLLILGSDSVVNGDVTAEAAMIGGVVNGNITAPGKVQLAETAKVNGNIKTDVLVVDEHAFFQGQCDMKKDEEPAKEKKAKAKKTEEKPAEEPKAEEPKAE